MSDLQVLLNRTSLEISFEMFLASLETTYPIIGKVERYEPITRGYEDANIKIFSSSGVYVVKLFSKKRTEQNISDYVRVLQEARNISVPVVELMQGNDGFLSHFEQDKAVVPYYVSRFFDGKDFSSTVPAMNDIQAVTTSLAKLNALDFPVDESYDSWGSRNLVAEYNKYAHLLNPEHKALVEPIVSELRHTNFATFKTGVIHGDMQRFHVLKNTHDKYCIIDFGCMANSYLVIELSVYLAWFCLAQDTWAQKDAVIAKVLETYQKRHKLTEAELASLPALVRASYAAYLMKTSLLIQQGDNTEQTRQWHENAKAMVHLSRDLRIKTKDATIA